ncbi:MAG: hypothetical protein NTY02_16045, partial [Acidobacteria bacterium]|nr:hypothetical protein [Acidobacteriota bacterium]
MMLPLNRRASRFAGALLAVTLGAAQPLAVQTPVPPAEGLALTHVERALEPGEVVLLTVSAPVPLVAASASAFGSSLPGFPGAAPSTWHVLLGIDLDTKPGAHPVTVEASTAAGARLTATITLSVAPKVFPTRHLTVPPQYVSPPKSALARIEKEQRLLARVLAEVTPSRLWGSGFQRPVPGAHISKFGVRSVFNGQARTPHRGADFAGT